MRSFRSKGKTLSGASADRRRFRIAPGHIMGACYGLLLGYFIFRNVPGTALCAAVFAPVMSGGRSREQRKRRIVRQAADLLESMAGMLAAGRSVSRSLSGACTELEEVYRCSGVTDTPVIDVVRQSKKSDDCAAVFSELSSMADSPELRAFAVAMEIMRYKGGNSAGLCRDTCDALRGKCDLADDIVTMRTDVDLSRAILMVMVPVVLIVFSMVGPDFLAPLYTGYGRIAAGAATALIAGGYVLAGAICGKIN